MKIKILELYKIDFELCGLHEVKYYDFLSNQSNPFHTSMLCYKHAVLITLTLITSASI